MQITHPIFGELWYDDYHGYTAKKIVSFADKEAEIEIVLKENEVGSGIEEAHCETFKNLMANWDRTMPNVLQAIIKYQNEEWSSTDHSQSFPIFKSPCDVLENVELCGIKIASLIQGHKKEDGCYVVLTFGADWVNDDYRLLSVALDGEKIVKVSDQHV